MKRVWVALSLFGSITLALSCEAVPEKAMPKPANDPVQLARDREVSLRWLDRLARVAKEGRYPDIAQRVERAKRFNSATPSTRCFLLAALTRDGKLNRHPVILVYFFNRLGDAKGIALLGRDKKQLASGPIPAEALGGVGNIPCGLLIVNVYPIPVEPMRRLLMETTRTCERILMGSASWGSWTTTAPCAIRSTSCLTSGMLWCLTKIRGGERVGQASIKFSTRRVALFFVEAGFRINDGVPKFKSLPHQPP
jgi:hypothetical protein